MAFSVTEKETFWKRTPKWINLKTPARWVSVDGENGTFWKRLRDNSHIIPVTISSKTIMWTEEHFIRFRDKSAIFKFIWLSVDGKPIRRKSCVFKFIRLSVDVATEWFFQLVRCSFTVFGNSLFFLSSSFFFSFKYMFVWFTFILHIHSNLRLTTIQNTINFALLNVSFLSPSCYCSCTSFFSAFGVDILFCFTPPYCNCQLTFLPVGQYQIYSCIFSQVWAG